MLGRIFPLNSAFCGTPRSRGLPEDSVVIANQMVKDLNYHYFYDALAREKILAKLGPELTADLYVNRSWHDRPPTVMREDLIAARQQSNDSDDDDDDEDSPGQCGDAEAHPRRFPRKRMPVNGSNDWVISGAHTVTGKPLLSNDMHLGHQMPNLWYEAHLHSGASRRRRRDAARDAVRHRRTQPAHRVGFHQRRPNRDRCLHRELQRAGRVPDPEWMGCSRSTARK